MSSLGCLHKAPLHPQKLYTHYVCHSIRPRCWCQTSTSCGFLDFWVGCWISRMAWFDEVCNVVIWRALLFVHQPVLDLLFQLLQKSVILERLSNVFCLFCSLTFWFFPPSYAQASKPFIKRSFKPSFFSAPFHGFLRRHENFPFISCALGAVDLMGLSPNWILPSSLMRWLMFILNVVVHWITSKFLHTSLAFIQVTLGCWAYLSAGCLTGSLLGVLLFCQMFF